MNRLVVIQLESEPESGIDDGEEGELNDPTDELEAKQQEAVKRAQSRYSSIFMRSLPPSISRQDISNMCKKFDGFIRVAFSHPQDERFYRRCWVTFDHSVNIKVSHEFHSLFIIRVVFSIKQEASKSLIFIVKIDQIQ